VFTAHCASESARASDELFVDLARRLERGARGARRRSGVGGG
jgi:hypothetical protein